MFNLMVFYPLALAAAYVVFRAAAPANAIYALDRAARPDWVAAVIVASMLALMVGL